MNNKLNIREIIECHNKESLYSPMCGECKAHLFVRAPGVVVTSKVNQVLYTFCENGCFIGGCQPMLWPSRKLYEEYPLDAELAWEEWLEDNAKRVVKTWEDIGDDPENFNGASSCISNIESNVLFSIVFGKELTKSAIALLKIRKLIDVAYGGNPTFDEKVDPTKEFWFISCHSDRHEFYVQKGGVCTCTDTITFYTKEQAEDFISHESNRQLIRDFYMV